MFKIECFCEDNKLAKVQWALDGLVLDFRSVPVRNAETNGSGIKSTVPSGSMSQTMAAEVKRSKLHSITTTWIKEHCVSLGFAESSYSHVRNELIAAKVIKLGKNRGEYEVLR